AMTAKDQVHKLIDALDDADAEFVLRYLKRLRSRDSGSIAIDEDEEMSAEEILRLARPITADDPLWNIVGMADSGPNRPTDVSRNKHKYLADAYADLHEE